MLVGQRMVIPHTYAHRDFSRNNQDSMRLSRTNRKQMIGEMVSCATGIRRFLELYDLDRIERFGGDVEH